MFLFDRELPSRQVVTHQYYKLLSVPRNASLGDIKTKFKKLAFVYHPDKGGDPTKFSLLREAYEVLSDPKKRRFYDQHGDAGLEHLQESTQPHRPPTTSSIVLSLPLDEFYTGVVKKIPYSRTVICMNCAGKGSQFTISCANCSGTGIAETTYRVGPMVFQNRGTCEMCLGSGESFSPTDQCSECLGQRTVRAQKELDVCVKPGTPVGHKLTFADAADQEPGRDTGDLVVVLQEAPHSNFRRVGDDLVTSLQVSLATALCGDSSSLELLDGQCITVQPPADYIIKPGTIGSIPGKGMPCFGREGSGTLYLKFHIYFPKSLPPRSRQLAKLLFPSEDDAPPASATPVIWTVASPEDLPQSETQEVVPLGENDVEGCRHQ